MRDIGTEPPDFVNAEGVKWWVDHDTTTYAVSKFKSKYKAVVYIVEHPHGRRERVLVVDDKVLGGTTTLEAMGCKIDVLAFINQGES